MSPNLQPPEKDNLDKPRTAPPGQTMRQAALETALPGTAVMTIANHAARRYRAQVKSCDNRLAE